MKKLFLSIIIIAAILSTNAQGTGEKTDKNSFSIQILKHGLGIDYERTIYKNFGLAISGGLAGAEIQAKYHLKPEINSPAIGFGTGYTWYTTEDLTDGKVTYDASRINMFFFEYRTDFKMIFTAGAGWFQLDDKARFRARAGIGWYFPW